MTSNIGSEAWIGQNEDWIESEAREYSRKALRATFPPEFINRVDEIIDFHPLSRDQILKIVGIQLNHVKALVQSQGYFLEVSEKAQQYLADLGYDPDYGARPLKRTIQKQLQDPLALSMLTGEFLVGDTIRVESGKEGLKFTQVHHGEVVGE